MQVREPLQNEMQDAQNEIKGDLHPQFHSSRVRLSVIVVQASSLALGYRQHRHRRIDFADSQRGGFNRLSQTSFATFTAAATRTNFFLESKQALQLITIMTTSFITEGVP